MIQLHAVGARFAPCQTPPHPLAAVRRSTLWPRRTPTQICGPEKLPDSLTGPARRSSGQSDPPVRPARATHRTAYQPLTPDTPTLWTARPAQKSVDSPTDKP